MQQSVAEVLKLCACLCILLLHVYYYSNDKRLKNVCTCPKKMRLAVEICALGAPFISNTDKSFLLYSIIIMQFTGYTFTHTLSGSGEVMPTFTNYIHLHEFVILLDLTST